MSFTKEERVIPSEHLSFDQIKGAASAGPSSLPPAASAHLGDCRHCAELVKFVNGLGQVKPDRATDLGDCPSRLVLLEIAEGLSVFDTSLYRHITQCHRCVTTLREFSEDLRDDNLPETKDLRTASPGWQRELAGKIAASAETTSREPGRSRLAWIPFGQTARWVYAAGIAMVFCLGVVSWFVWRSRPSYADRLLADAYTAQRTMEMRISGARYAPLRVQRGSSRFDRPASLLEAEEVIARKLAAHPNDPGWLQAKARADLLEGNYESSLASLRRALEIAPAPESPQLLIDLATAYFMRAESTDHALDYGTAMECLGQALSKSPDDPIALFNRAIVSERTFLYTQAVEDWEHYLRIDPTGTWADEARRRLAALREKLKTHEQSQDEPLQSPRQFVETARGRDGRAKGAIDQRVEDYLNIALLRWLPSAFPIPARDADSRDADSRNALSELGALQAQKHGDGWLLDLLAGPQSSKFARAIDALRKAREANEAGDPAAGKDFAVQAGQLFRRLGNVPGILRAQLEEVYSLQRSVHGHECLMLLTPLRASLRNNRYTWMEGQALLEGAVCWTLVGNLESAQHDLEDAIAVTHEARYDVLHLRGLAFEAGLATEKGDEADSWARNLAGLSAYWSGSYPRISGYQFYADLADGAESAGRGQVAQRLWAEAATTIALTSNRSGEAMARYRLATVSLMSGDSSTAEREFARASRIFASLPQTPAVQAYELDGEVALASLHADRGSVNGTVHRLNTLKPRLYGLTDYRVALDFHRTLGKLYLQLGDYQLAERSFLAAINIGEWSARSLQTDADRLAWERATGAAYRGLVVTYNLQRRSPLETLDLWEWYRALPSRVPANITHYTRGPYSRSPDFVNADKLGVRIVPTSIREALPQLSNETILAYDVQPGGISIWEFDDRGVELMWVQVSSEELAAVAHRFAARCSDPGSNPATLLQDSQQLYRWLILPAEGRLTEGRTLVIEPDGPVDDVPVQALADSSRRYLGSRFALVISPGFWYQRQLREGPPISNANRALIVGASAVPPELAGSLRPLPDAEREATAIASRFLHSKLLTGSQATLTDVQSQMTSTSVFHFAGHFLSGQRHDGLLLSQATNRESTREADRTSLLSASTLKPQTLKQCQLAVLSACRTATGEELGMIDPSGIVRAFLQAKVPHIVATRWNVDSAVSLVFMNEFYSELLTGHTVSQSIRKGAQQIRENPLTSHPYYWAAYNVFGRE